MNDKPPKKPRKKRAKRHSLTTWIESVDFPIVRPRPKHLNHFGLSGGPSVLIGYGENAKARLTQCADLGALVTNWL